MSRKVQYIMPQGCMLIANFGSVVDFSYPSNPTKSAIVNAANIYCLGGGGVDGAITRAGGPRLHLDRAALPVLRSHSDPLKAVRCATGQAVVTGPNAYGYLHTPFVIHAVGPNYSKDKYIGQEEKADHKLKKAYANSMKLAADVGVESLAFSLLSTGSYRGENRSIHDLLRIAMSTIFEGQYSGLKEVHLCGYSGDEFLAIIEVAYEYKLTRVSE